MVGSCGCCELKQKNLYEHVFGSDYNGALGSGWKALLLRRVGPQGEGERKEANEILEGVHVIHGLDEVVTWVAGKGSDSAHGMNTFKRMD